MAAEPILFRFAQPCLSPERAPKNPDYVYDESIDMVRWLGAPGHPPVIEAYRFDGGPEDPPNPPKTKKCDIEKGEDQKDRRMWRRR